MKIASATPTRKGVKVELSNYAAYATATPVEVPVTVTRVRGRLVTRRERMLILAGQLVVIQ